jgi:hypothetical protein
MDLTLVHIYAEVDDGYPVAVSRGGVHVVNGVLPKAVVESFNPKMKWDTFVGAGEPTDELEQIGRDVQALLKQAGIYDAIIGQPGEGRISLQVDAPELRQVPWELCLDGMKDPIAIDAARPLSRLVPHQGKSERKWPLKVLVVLAPDPVLAERKETRIDTGAEILRISTALTGFRSKNDYRPLRPDVDVTVLRTPSRQQLRAELERLQPGLLHIIGHGYFDSSPNPSTYLEIYDGENKWEWRAADIRADFKSRKVPPFVVLNACLAADGRAAEGHSAALAFLEAGALAVVGIQSEIYDRRSLDFARSLYQSLGRGEALDIAVTRGRNAVYSESPKIRDWAAPVLFVGDTSTLESPPIESPVKGMMKEEIHHSFCFRKLRGFVGRREERLQDWTLVPSKLKRVVVLRGKPETGKSWLAHAIAERRAMFGDLVRVISLDAGEVLDPLGFARRVVMVRDENGPPTCPVTQPLPLEFFSDFVTRARELGGLGPLGPGVRARARDIPAKLTVPKDERLSDLYAALRTGLTALCDDLDAKQRGLLLIVDGLEAIVKSTFDDYVAPFVVDFFVESEHERLQLILVVDARENNRYESVAAPIDISEFSQSEAGELIRSAARQIYNGFPDELPVEDTENHDYWKLVDVYLRMARILPMFPPTQLRSMVAGLRNTCPNDVEAEPQ